MSELAWAGREASLLRRGLRHANVSTVIWTVAAGAFAVGLGLVSARSLLVAGGMLAPLGILLAGELPLTVVVGGALTLRVLLDHISGAAGQQSTNINPSALIAVVFLALAGLALYRFRRGVGVALLAAAALSVATALAVLQMGAHSVVVREPLREASIVALAIAVFNYPRFTALKAARIVQIAGAASAAIALYQALTGGGMEIAGSMRSNGTFSHPNSAALYFAIAATASLWRYFDFGHRLGDALFVGLYVTASIVTFSLGGMATLVAMFLTYGALRRGSAAIRIGAWAVTGLLVVIFIATPLGASRLSAEASQPLGTTYSATQSSNSINWRIYNWRTLIPVWKRSPIVGEGLGSTVAGLTPTGQPPHNEYIRYLVETGVAGLALLLWSVLLLVRALRRKRQHAATAASGVLGLALMTGLMLDALVSNTLLYTPAAYAAAVIIAATLRRDEPAADG